MALKNCVKAIPLTSIDSTDVSPTYAAINPDGLPNACFQIKIYNDSDEDVTVSYDGVTDNVVVPAGDVEPLAFQTNLVPTNNAGLMAAGTIVWVKGTMGTGNIYLSGYYMPNGI